MGSSSSKPSSTSSSPLVWKASSDLVEALEASPETNVSRKQGVELEIQARVAAELKRLQKAEAAALKDAQEKLSAARKQAGTEDQSGPSRHVVSKEVAALHAKLVERRKVRDLPEGVEAARGEVVRCLRENDRRPLDCWREVEQFKEEVRRLEKGWVDKVVS
ncbi:hypothetical protein B0T24DRAFT_54507 [Lasiosphaeria ovina]|uniref:MICOS complex subunit mic19 n=1 Tax=Lasiosphaeria ovina TaxID=92902 RepID=A0AAE0NL66_9PEZI|nr:hypothetical protein B0T24DRAFT_54507 [Lasiosphaeria ovina]